MSINIGTAPYVGTITLTEGSPLHVKFVFSTPISTTVLIHWPDINNGYDVEFPVVNGVGYVDFDAETVWDMINDYRGSYYNRVPYVKIINTYIRLTTVNIVSTGRYDNG